MEIQIRYENINESKDPITVIIEVPDSDCTLMIETDYEERLANAADGEEVSRRSVQEIMDEEFNKPLYNIWHREHRHRGEILKPYRKDDEDVDDTDGIDTVADYSQETRRNEQWSYDSICSQVREALSKRPHWAEAFIAIKMDGMSVNDYAASIGIKDASIVSHWLGRAVKKLAENF